METTRIALFKGKKIRKTIFDNEWWFSVFELSTICRWLKLQAPDGKMRDTDCANTEDRRRVI